MVKTWYSVLLLNLTKYIRPSDTILGEYGFNEMPMAGCAAGVTKEADWGG